MFDLNILMLKLKVLSVEKNLNKVHFYNIKHLKFTLINCRSNRIKKF